LLACMYLQPTPPRQKGATYCLPWLGPHTIISPELSDTARTRVAAHEAVHAAQCRSLGSWRMYLADWSVARRLKLEAEAGCAEARVTWAQGHRPAHALEELVDNLVYGVQRGSRPTPEAARAAAVAACPDLANAQDPFMPLPQVVPTPARVWLGTATGLRPFSIRSRAQESSSCSGLWRVGRVRSDTPGGQFMGSGLTTACMKLAGRGHPLQ
jgi:hypothetical protein